MISESLFVAGHRGLVGSAMVRELKAAGYSNLITRTRAEVDLLDSNAVARFFDEARPAVVVLAAAKVGGIRANIEWPVEFLLENLKIQNNVIEHAARTGVRKLLFLGSSCIYPKLAPQPIPEEALLSSALEPTNEPYAIAKIAGIKLCQAYSRQYGKNFIAAMPTNLYGPGDNFDLQSSHVLPALVRKMHDAKVSGASEVTLWGTGTARREFLHVEDLARACRFLIEEYNAPEIINVGWGEDVTIRELAGIVREVVGFGGELVFDITKPDGTPRKLLDTTKLRQLGWQPRITLQEGIASTYDWFLRHGLGK